MAVNDADTGLIVQRGGIDELVDARGGFFDGASDYIYFFDGGLIGGLGLHGDSAACGCYRVRGFRRWGFDAENIFERDFHAHWAGFDFCGASVHAAENYGLLHAFDAQARAFF